MGEHHHHGHRAESNLKLAFWLNAVFALVEIAGGVLTNSVSILSNAFHDLGDSVALGLAWYFQRVSAKERDATYTYGYKRYSLVGASISALILLAGSVVIIVHAVPRLMAPEPVKVQGMVYLALAGILVNALAMLRLREGHSQNEKVISIHLLEDVLGWTAVLIVGIVMRYWDVPVLDPVLSLMITCFILYRAFGSMKETFGIFMQAMPSKEEMAHYKEHLVGIEGIEDVHDMHFWTLDGNYHIGSLHVSVNPLISVAASEEIKKAVRDFLRDEGYEHTTIEIEPSGQPCELKDC